uniref:Reverse transcriptase domain-containing protein n=1 Tax=Trichuris muris TaxID=70415 RepID=A0A5S6PZ36_TRIMR
MCEYPPAKEARGPYETELRGWIDHCWLLSNDENRSGPSKGLVAVVQRSKKEVRPMMDFREMNAHFEAYTANAAVCAEKLRNWRRMEMNLAMVDLSNGYLQVRLDESLLPYQTVIFNGRRYCLIRLDFGLNVAPLVMRTLLNHVLFLHPKKGTSAHVDDILVNENIVSAREVHSAQYRLSFKAPDNVADGARVLGLLVWCSCPVFSFGVGCFCSVTVVKRNIRHLTEDRPRQIHRTNKGKTSDKRPAENNGGSDQSIGGR